MLLNSGGVYVSGWTFPNRCDHPGCNPHTKSYKGTVRSPHKKQRVNKPTPQKKKQQVEKEKVTFYGWFLVGFLNWTCILPKPTLWYIIVFTLQLGFYWYNYRFSQNLKQTSMSYTLRILTPSYGKHQTLRSWQFWGQKKQVVTWHPKMTVEGFFLRQ